MTSPLITPSELSSFIGVPEGTLAQWRYLGKGPAYARLGRHVRYRRDDVESWLESQTQRGDVRAPA